VAYKTVRTLRELQEYLNEKKLVAFDFETAPNEQYRKEEKSALDAHKAHIVGISFSVAEETAVYLPLTHKVGENAENTTEVWEFLEKMFTSKDIIKVAHNLAFESAFLYSRGIILQEPCYDTIAASQLVYKGEKEFRSLADSGLKTLAPDLLGVNLPTYSEVVGNKHFDELNPQDEKTINYACADSDFTLRLYHLFNNWFDRFLPKHRWVVENIESPTAVYVGLMRYNGLPVDRQLMEQKRLESEHKIVQLKDEIKFIIGDVPIGANASTAAFKKYLFDTQKLPKVKQTTKNSEALDDEALILLKEWCVKNSRTELVKLFDLVQDLRHTQKIKTTYIDGYLKHINSATGRIHPDLLPLATETGRFASKNPNCQNMPRAGADDVGVRNFIVAPEGKVLLSLDFSQIELRVGAFYCKDPKMLETYQNGGDIHAMTTAVIYRIPLEEALDKHNPKYKERRTIAKNCNFGTFFGLFPKGLQKTLKFKAGLDVSLDECERIIRNIKLGYPQLSRWQEETKKRASFRHYTETWLGRRRALDGITSPNWNVKSFAERCSMNTPIQGTAADILKLALGRILKGLPERPWLKPLLQIHDELVFELPEQKLNEAVEFIKMCMEQKPFDAFCVPLVAESAVGQRFGELHELP
jgi:DNA polymerase-1